MKEYSGLSSAVEARQSCCRLLCLSVGFFLIHPPQKTKDNKITVNYNNSGSEIESVALENSYTPKRFLVFNITSIDGCLVHGTV